MIGIYFSGTGNSRYCIHRFLEEYDKSSPAFSIEQAEAVTHVIAAREIVICYPVQFSNIPKILQDYIVANRQIWNGKRIFIIATMGLFSGDGGRNPGTAFQKIRCGHNRRPASENAGQYLRRKSFETKIREKSYIDKKHRRKDP